MPKETTNAENLFRYALIGELPPSQSDSSSSNRGGSGVKETLKCNNKYTMLTMLGVEKNEKSRTRKRIVLNLFIENGEINYKKGVARLTKSDKDNLIFKLE